MEQEERMKITELRPTQYRCRICKVAVEPSPEAAEAQWVLCPLHNAMLVEPTHHLRHLRELADMVARGQLAHVGNGLTPIQPKPTTPRPIDYTDDGTPRYRDMSNRLGVTLLPGDDPFNGDERQ
jgi:hypothetical protein